MSIFTFMKKCGNWSVHLSRILHGFAGKA